MYLVEISYCYIIWHGFVLTTTLNGGKMEKSNKQLLELARRNLSIYRHASGFSQEILAERSGISQSQISFLESGKRKLKLDQLIPLAKGLGISVAQLTETVDPEEAALFIKFNNLRKNKTRVKNWNAIVTLIENSEIK